MNFEEHINVILSENGFLSDETRKILSLIKADPCNGNMKDRWRDDMALYPQSVHAIILDSVYRIMLAFLEGKVQNTNY